MSNLQIINHQDQRVLTTAQLAESYETDENTITKNFGRNKDRYTEGKHYFCLEGEDLKGFKRDMTNCHFAQNINKLYLWTEKGAWLHAKSLNTDKAWEAYETLVDEYYRVKDQVPTYHLPQNYSEALRMLADEVEHRERLQIENASMKPKAELYDVLISAGNSQSMGEVAKAYGWGRNKLFRFLRENNILMNNNTPYQRYLDDEYFEVREITTNRGGMGINVTQTLVTAKGIDLIGKLLKRTGKIVPFTGREAN